MKCLKYILKILLKIKSQKNFDYSDLNDGMNVTNIIRAMIKSNSTGKRSFYEEDILHIGARKNSQGVKNKNIKLINGNHLFNGVSNRRKK